MEPEPRDDPGGTGAEPKPGETPERDEPAADAAPAPDVEDDGSIPEKQIQRWKDEGGAVAPPE
jgi:hypothetical protein